MASSERVPIYALCTSTHAEMRDEYFLPSLPSNLELRIQEIDIPQKDGGVYRSESFRRAVRLKVDMILEAVEDCRGGIFIVSDVDIVFFRTFDPFAYLHDDLDLVAQENGDKAHNYCAGFYICRANESAERLMKALRKRLAKKPNATEQPLFNELMVKLNTRRAYLPTTFYNPMGRDDWRERVPDDPILFHANWCRGIAAKMNYLEYMRQRFS